MDPLDKKVLTYLKKKDWASTREIADAMGLTIKYTLKRLSSLERFKDIKKEMRGMANLYQWKIRR